MKEKGLFVVFMILLSFVVSVIIVSSIASATLSELVFPVLGVVFVVVSVPLMLVSLLKQKALGFLLLSWLMLGLGAFFLLEHFYFAQRISHGLLDIAMTIVYLLLIGSAFFSVILFLEDAK